MKFQMLHGGDLDWVERVYKIDKNTITDFSGNINPFGPSLLAKEKIIRDPDSISKYPDPEYNLLRENISKYLGVPKEYILVGNGSTELISLFIKTVNPKVGVIVSPAYSEYQREINILGGKIISFPLREENNFVLEKELLFKELLNSKAELLVITNPNNPTGSYLNNEELKEILEFTNKNSIFVLLDETYVEFSEAEETGVLLCEEYNNLFVVRGTSKFFASPGLRLGYSVCKNEEVLEKIKKIKDPWSVNTFADIAGSIMFGDKEYIEKTKKFITDERNYILEILSGWKNIKVYPTKSNFILIKILTDKINSDEIFEKLIVERMLIRNASSFEYLDESFLRFCIQSKEENRRLLEALKNLIE